VAAPHPESEVVPADESAFKTWMNAIFPAAVRLAWNQMHFDSTCRPEARAMEFLNVVTAYLLPIRNRIAHSLVGPGELASSIDNALDIQTVFHWLPLLKCIARRMLKNEFPSELMPGLREDGSLDASEEERRRAEWEQIFKKR